ncbi:MAG TPA: S1 RNA-binding domain-containing protein, partial [Pseudomonadota bacterium]|nr:S1 RNA-binding domain-containing protein [Pseudomonadota bacterium]
QLTAQVGDEITARIVEIDGRGGGVVLRRTLGRGPDARGELRQAFELGIPFEGTVSGVVKGGVEVQVAGVRGFCPISQLDLRHTEDASGYVGQKLQFRITRFEENGRSVNVVLSRRALLEEAAQALAEELRKKLAPGVVARGRVTALKDYGAFIDLGGIEGMLHVSELSFQRARLPKDVLSVGQELEVAILKIEPSQDPKRPERISLSLKSLEKDPWSDIETQFPVGTRFPATVLRTEAFGAIVELVPGIEGLVHISELGGGKRLRHAKEAVQPGAKIEVVIQQIDRDKRRLSLGMASPTDVEGGEAAPSAPSGGGRVGFGTLGDLLSKASQKKK